MGIPSYFSYIIKNYSNIIYNQKQIVNENICFCYLFMDCNSIIYDEVRKLEINIAKKNDIIVNFENTLINNVISTIGDYIHNISPSQLVYIAFDGVAPFAKMTQQRTRRHKGSILSKIDSVLQKTTSNIDWSTSNITPGTQFMNNLSIKVKKAFSNLESHFNVKKIIVSGSDVCGEGEHKMFQYIRENINKSTGDALVYGLDSDLIMLSLFHCEKFKNLFIYRETPEFGKKLVSNENADSDYLFLNIRSLSKAILNEMNCDTNDNHRLYDYIFMCFLLGNDFLPHFPSLNLRTNGIDILLDTYKQTLAHNNSRSFISNSLEIQWRWVYMFISELAKNEKDRFTNEYSTREKLSKRKWNMNNTENKEFTVQNVPVIYRQQELYIAPNEYFWEQRYYNTLFSHSNVDVKHICDNYLEGLEWVFKYYTSNCPNWRWSYKYHYPPLLKDLCKYIPKKQMAFFDNIKYNPFSPLVQLSYVLPMKNHSLLPLTVNEYLKEHESQYYIDNPKYEWAFCRYFWESHPVLPEIPISTMEKWNTLWN